VEAYLWVSFIDICILVERGDVGVSFEVGAVLSAISGGRRSDGEGEK
jgi:hypothetical protein